MKVNEFNGITIETYSSEVTRFCLTGLLVSLNAVGFCLTIQELALLEREQSLSRTNLGSSVTKHESCYVRMANRNVHTGH